MEEELARGRGGRRALCPCLSLAVPWAGAAQPCAVLLMPSRWRGLSHACVSREGDGQSVTLRDSCADWTGARTGPGLEGQPQTSVQVTEPGAAACN